MAEFGTKVKNPMRHSWQSGYAKCPHCGKYYTQLGISRHWDKCPKKPAKQ